MENEYSIARESLGGRTPETQFFTQQVRRLASREEYLREGIWTSEPTGTITSRRFIFPTTEERNAALDTIAMSKEFQTMQTNNPVLPEKIFARLAEARRIQVPITLFVPWGVRPEGEIGKEYEALDTLQEIQAKLSILRIPSQLLIMPADVYATEVNGLDSKRTDTYFAQITTEATQRGMIVKPWSQIREENRQLYDVMAGELTREKLEAIIGSAGTMQKVFQAASRRSERGNTQQAAYAYLRERVIEAQIVERRYCPIKMGFAPKNKDNNIDGPLPRLYVIPESLQFPWLQ
jgi:hypothetical protein